MVMAEGKFIHIQWQILLTDMMKTAHNPAFQQRPETIQVGGMHQAPDIFSLTVRHALMGIALLLQQTVARVFISGHQRDIIGYRLTHKLSQGLGVSVFNDLGYHLASSRHSPNNGHLSGGASAFSPFGFMSVLVFAADKGFVDLNFTLQGARSATHSSPPPVTHIPGGPVIRSRIFPKDDTVQLQGTHALFGHQHEVAHFKPKFQGNLGVLKDGVGQHRKPISVASPTAHVFTGPMKRLGMKVIDFFMVLATRTGHTLRPAHLNQELLTGVFGGELFVEVTDGLHGKVLSLRSCHELV